MFNRFTNSSSITSARDIEPTDAAVPDAAVADTDAVVVVVLVVVVVGVVVDDDDVVVVVAFVAFVVVIAAAAAVDDVVFAAVVVHCPNSVSDNESVESPS